MNIDDFPKVTIVPSRNGGWVVLHEDSIYTFAAWSDVLEWLTKHVGVRP